MTTLQELEKAFDETIEYSTLLLSTNGDSSMLSENIKDINLIKSFIEKSYLAGKEDEKKRVVEIINNHVAKLLKWGLNVPEHTDGYKVLKMVLHEVNKDLKQSIIK
jgi:hypothetical protein